MIGEAGSLRPTRFRDRAEGGRALAAQLRRYASADPIVLALPRGGVPVAFEVARALRAPLDVIVVRKLGLPYQPELGMGAIGEDGVLVLNREIVVRGRVTERDLASVEQRERAELDRRARCFRGGLPMLRIDGRTVIIVDDGLATGSTARAAVQVARAHGAARVVLATPVAPADTLAELARDADDVVCVSTPEPFYAIGQWYDDFSQTSDEEVVRLLAEARGWATPAAGRGATPSDADIVIDAGGVRLPGRLTVPASAQGIVVFAHGSGSSRHSPRNQEVARTLQRQGLGTLLFDLLTDAEAEDRAKVFDIPLLGARLDAATAWVGAQADLTAVPVGLFGASTGAGAALWSAGEPGSPVRAVVSRGGRPDLAGPRLALVRAPTLLIVGGRDSAVIDLNRDAATQLRCEHRLEIVPGATHLFEEHGALDQVASLATAWFLEHLPGTEP